MSKQNQINKTKLHPKYIVPKDSKITKINEYQVLPFNDKMQGLVIETNNGNIIISIDNYSCCCEDLGSKFLETPDNLEYYIGSTIKKIKSFDKKYSKDCCDDENNIETVLNIETSKGLISYSVYNSHNGYYSHGTLIQVFDKIIEKKI